VHRRCNPSYFENTNVLYRSLPRLADQQTFDRNLPKWIAAAPVAYFASTLSEIAELTTRNTRVVLC
jgi:hypothetical protein